MSENQHRLCSPDFTGRGEDRDIQWTITQSDGKLGLWRVFQRDAAWLALSLLRCLYPCWVITHLLVSVAYFQLLSIFTSAVQLPYTLVLKFLESMVSTHCLWTSPGHSAGCCQTIYCLAIWLYGNRSLGQSDRHFSRDNTMSWRQHELGFLFPPKFYLTNVDLSFQAQGRPSLGLLSFLSLPPAQFFSVTLREISSPHASKIEFSRTVVLFLLFPLLYILLDYLINSVPSNILNTW